MMMAGLLALHHFTATPAHALAIAVAVPACYSWYGLWRLAGEQACVFIPFVRD